jgi:hypothetical protein
MRIGTIKQDIPAVNASKRLTLHHPRRATPFGIAAVNKFYDYYQTWGGMVSDLTGLLEVHPADAAVLVMPDIDGGKQYELQCLNDPGGLQDMTFVGQDVPDYIARVVRVQPPGRAWGLGGYSEGGYCTANIALQELGRYGAAGVMSGYFAPVPSLVPAGNKPGGKPTQVNVFARDPARGARHRDADEIATSETLLRAPRRSVMQ